MEGGWGGARKGAGRPLAAPTKVVRLPVDVADAARRVASARGGSASGIEAFLRAEARVTASAPLVTAAVACGFPSPAEDSLDRPLDLNELHGIGAPSVFLVGPVANSGSGGRRGCPPLLSCFVRDGKSEAAGEQVVLLADGPSTREPEALAQP